MAEDIKTLSEKWVMQCPIHLYERCRLQGTYCYLSSGGGRTVLEWPNRRPLVYKKPITKEVGFQLLTEIQAGTITETDPVRVNQEMQNLRNTVAWETAVKLIGEATK